MARRNARPKRAAFAKRLIIMAKSPVLGRVKRRLASEVGHVAALRFYRASLAHTVQRLAGYSRWHTLIAVSPDQDLGARFWPRNVARIPQGRGDLGSRMQRLFARMPPGPVVIVGSDIPALSSRHVAKAFALLGDTDAVLGPAPDGGYWLIGLKRIPKLLRPFTGVRWSGPHALADTLANLEGKRVALAPLLSDVDTGMDLKRIRVSGRLIAGAGLSRTDG